MIDAGILRLRPVLITVGATVLALFPLALHGGPLVEAAVLCANWWLAAGDRSDKFKCR